MSVGDWDEDTAHTHSGYSVSKGASDTAKCVGKGPRVNDEMLKKMQHYYFVKVWEEERERQRTASSG